MAVGRNGESVSILSLPRRFHARSHGAEIGPQGVANIGEFSWENPTKIDIIFSSQIERNVDHELKACSGHMLLLHYYFMRSDKLQ